MVCILSNNLQSTRNAAFEDISFFRKGTGGDREPSAYPAINFPKDAHPGGGSGSLAAHLAPNAFWFKIQALPHFPSRPMSLTPNWQDTSPRPLAYIFPLRIIYRTPIVTVQTSMKLMTVCISRPTPVVRQIHHANAQDRFQVKVTRGQLPL